MTNFIDPKTLALLGASAGFLDPNGGMMGGFQGALQGFQAGSAMQENAMKQKEMLRKIQMQNEAQEFLAKHVEKGTNQRDLIKAMSTTGNPFLLEQAKLISSTLPKAKTFLKDRSGNYMVGYDTGEVSDTGSQFYERPMQVDTGNQALFVDPVSGQPTGGFNKSMAPGEAARLAQSDRQFNMSNSLAQQRAALENYKAFAPRYENGAWVTPPAPGQQQGSIKPTEYFTAPKGSQAEKQKSSANVLDVLGSDTEELIKRSTGSYSGQAADFAARSLGLTTPGAAAINTLKVRASTLAGNVPRFEGPQSDADRQYYLEMVGDLANPSKTVGERLAAYKEVVRINKMASPNGSVNLHGNTGGYKIERLD